MKKRYKISLLALVALSTASCSRSVDPYLSSHETWNGCYYNTEYGSLRLKDGNIRASIKGNEISAKYKLLIGKMVEINTTPCVNTSSDYKFDSSWDSCLIFGNPYNTKLITLRIGFDFYLFKKKPCDLDLKTESPSPQEIQTR